MVHKIVHSLTAVLVLSCMTFATSTNAENPPEAPKADAAKIDPAKLDGEKVIAKFPDGTTILMKELLKSIETLPPQLKEAPFEKIYEALLNRIIDMKLISNAARKAGVDKDAEVLKKIEDAKEAMIQKAYLDKEIAKLITVEALKEKYQEVLKMMPKDQFEIRLKHILVKTKAEAEKVIREIKDGKKFDDLAKEKSVDEQTKEQGGDLGYVRRSDLPKEFGDAVFKAAKATLVPEPVNLGELGFSVVRVEDKRPIEPPKFEEIKGEIYKAVTPQYAADFIKGLRTEAKVEKFDTEGKPLVEKVEEKKADAPAVSAVVPAPAVK